MLSDAFAHLRVRGAIFLTGLYTEKWAYRSVPTEDIAALLIPGEERVILFHLIASAAAGSRSRAARSTGRVPAT